MFKRPLLLSLFLLALLFACPQITSAADQWTRVQSKNFHLIGNASDKEIRRVATKMEQFREVFSRLFPKMKFTSPVPTTVIVFKSGKAFKPFKPVNADGKTTDWTAGYFQGGEDINYIVLSTEGEKKETYQTIFHEYVHLLLNNSLGKSTIPPWFNEGLAEYYDQFSIEDDQKVMLGGINNSHLYTLSRAKLIPLDTFFNIDYMSLHRQGNHSANIFYAQSWALMHYLIQGNQGKRLQEMAAFLEMVRSGTKPADAFTRAFKMDYAAMEQELRKYVEQNRFSATVATFSKKLQYEDSMKSSPMTEADAKANLGDLLLHSNRLKEAETYLAESLALEPGSAMANTSFGMVRMRQNNFAEARKYLDKAVSSDSRNFMVLFRYAYVLSHEGRSTGMVMAKYSSDDAEKIRAALKRSIELNPDYPESHGLLAYVGLIQNEQLDESVNSLKKALALSPGNQVYQFNLASLYLRKSDPDAALAIAEGLYRSADDPGLRSRAEAIINSIKSFKEHVANMEKIRGGAADAPQIVFRNDDRQLTKEEIDKINADAHQQSIEHALRTPQAGEVRIAAHLTAIKCVNGNISYLVRHGSSQLKLRSKDFDALTLMSFVPGDLQIGCDTITKEIYAILTYIPNPDPKTKTQGEMIAIEIVPEVFKLTEDK